MIYIIFGVLAIIGVGGQFFVARRRSRRDYKEILSPILNTYGLTLISSKFPGWFKVGPFPKFMMETGRPQSKVPLLGRGEYSQYRIITVSDEDSRRYKLWALLEFEIFRLRHVRWRVEKGDTIPDAVISLIEK